MIAFALVIAISTAAQASVNCTVEGITHNCKPLKDKGWTQYITLKDGTWFRNPEYDNSVWKAFYESHVAPTSVSETRQRKLKELVEFARETIINELRDGRSDDQLPTEVKNQISRVRYVHYNYEESLRYNTSACAPSDPNAYFLKETNSLIICRSMMMIPDAGLITVIAHELCHSIDPCTLTYQYSADPVIEPSKQPYGGQLRCLRERGLADEYPESEEQIKAALGFLDSEVSTFGVKILTSDIKAHRTCYSPKRKVNTARESIPDMCAGLVAAKYIKAHPPKDDMERIAMLTPFIDRLCGPPVNESTIDGHMETPDRINKIMLADPGIAEALGCNSVTTSCLHPAPMVIASPKDTNSAQ